MKKIIFFSFLFFIISCNKNDKLDSSLNLSLNTPLPSLPTNYLAPEHFKNMVNSAAIGILGLINDNTFRNEVNSKIALHFDNDDDVLLKNLNFHPSNGLTIQQIFQNSINSYGNLSVSLSQNIDNYNFGYYNNIDTIQKFFTGFEDNANGEYHKSFIHIFVPFFDSININGIPTIVVGIGDEALARGYKFDNQGNLQVVTVDENYAKNNLVWVISANERVDVNGIYNSGDVITPAKDTITKNVNERMGVTYKLRMFAVNPRDQKESCMNGGPEVSVLFTRSFNLAPCTEGVVSEWDCKLVRCLSKNQCKLNTLFQCDLSKVFNEAFSFGVVNFDPSMHLHGWIIYEDDWWYQNEFTYPSCQTIKHFLKTNDTEYGIQDQFAFNGAMSFPIGVWNDFTTPSFNWTYWLHRFRIQFQRLS